MVGIDYLKLLLSNDFDIVKAFDGCNADVIIKPKTITTNNWLGLQIKSTRVAKTIYSVHLGQDYADCVVMGTANKRSLAMRILHSLQIPYVFSSIRFKASSNFLI